MRMILVAFSGGLILGTVLTLDGRSHAESVPQAGGTAIILPLADKKVKQENYKLTDTNNGVRFDLDGDGIEEQIAWTHGSSGLGFLALDRNGDGKINNGKELFGNFTRSDASNGFAALLREAGPYGAYGAIEVGHRLFEKLLLWEDQNHNGLSDAGEMQKFSDHYVLIALGWEPDTSKDEYGNQFRYRGNVAIRIGESKKMLQAKTVCDAGPFGTLRNCVLDRSDELSRIIDIYDVRLVQR